MIEALLVATGGFFGAITRFELAIGLRKEIKHNFQLLHSLLI